MNISKYDLMELEDLAVDLALAAFKDPVDEHIQAIHERLVWNAQHGLGDQGATTIH